MKQVKKDSRGFSIVELLIALVIISILTMIAIVLVANRVRKARSTAALADMTQIRDGLDHASLDTGYYYRLYVLNDTRGSDGVGWTPPGPSQPPSPDRIDSLRDEELNTVAPNPQQIFISIRNGEQLNAATASVIFSRIRTNETKFGWEGGYVAWQREDEFTGLPLDPWGSPYILFTAYGFMDENTGRIYVGTARNTILRFPGDPPGSDRGRLTPLSFDRMTLVSLGPDGMVGDGANPGTDIGQGDDLFMSW